MFFRNGVTWRQEVICISTGVCERNRCLPLPTPEYVWPHGLMCLNAWLLCSGTTGRHGLLGGGVACWEEVWPDGRRYGLMGGGVA